MEKAFTIEQVHNKYCQQVVDLILPIQQIEFNVPVTLDAQPDLLDIDQAYFAAGGGFWGAFHKGELVGTIALLNTGHKSGAIRKMFVKKEFRGKEFGIAQALLDTLFAYCADKQIDHLYLGTVEALKAAQRFYERNGFEKVEADDLPDYFPRMKVDTLFYKFSIAAQ
ncbi:GNAT family N-acetyltransferase [Pseudoflavitalea sp. G-6-1-2]|uniref:GNAT family N-acetyltransferase n=1 Tax=Pseudoflavitalea sp. G-6-1-2 TaxID=2728841 RepID=UPI00146F6D6A|nr:GNAT family N-acetyltransferase [Pseudoflavitalea sp. G-6-1-2]NML21443.1 GNAT family N-acetyltransferase [Pseudoflavitalea sp. G-6-1-2]